MILINCHDVLILQEKKPYLDKVAELKAEYEKAMESYEAGQDEEVCL